jgi:hypothetical protein
MDLCEPRHQLLCLSVVSAQKKRCGISIYRFSEKYFSIANLTGIEDLSGFVKLFI